MLLTLRGLGSRWVQGSQRGDVLFLAQRRGASSAAPWCVGSNSTLRERSGRSRPPAQSPRASIAFPFRPRTRHLEGHGSRPDRATICFPASGLAARCPAWRSKCCCGASLALHGARLPKRIPRLGGQRNPLPARARRTRSSPRDWRQGRTSLPPIGRAGAPARADGRLGAALREDGRWKRGDLQEAGLGCAGRGAQMDDFEEDTRLGCVYLAGYVSTDELRIPRKPLSAAVQKLQCMPRRARSGP